MLELLLYGFAIMQRRLFFASFNCAFATMKDWDNVRYFLAVAHSGSAAAAAQSLGVNASTVFRRIESLESALQTRLFDRLPRGYALTDAGERLVPIARKAEQSLFDMEREIAGKDHELEGDVRITAPANIANRFLAPALAQFTLLHPRIVVELSISDTDYDLSRREADVAVRATSTPPDHLVGRKICDLRWHLAASREYLEKAPAVHPEDLCGHRLIGGSSQFQRLKVFADLEKLYAESVVARADNLDTMRHLAQSGMGLACLPDDQAGAEGLVILGRPFPDIVSQLWILTHPDLRFTARIRSLVEHLTQHLRQTLAATAESESL